MRSFKLTLFYGLLLWLIHLAAILLIAPLRESQQGFFETIIPLIVVAAAGYFSMLFFGKIDTNYLNIGIYVGSAWFGMNIALDLLMLLWRSTPVSFINYMSKIGLVYIVYPIITICFGYLLERKFPPMAESPELPACSDEGKH